MKRPNPLTISLRKLRDFIASERVSLFPFLGALRQYNTDAFRNDGRAAISVTMLAVSQSLAFAAIAGLPIIYGVMCSAVAAIVAPLFSASRHTIMGPTNATSLMLFSFFSLNPGMAARPDDVVPLLVLMVGIWAVIGAVMRIADLLQYVSRSVLVGYISGAAVLILINQSVHFLGLADQVEASGPSTFAGLVITIAQALMEVEWISIGIGSVTLAGYLALRKWKPHWPAFALMLLLSSMVFGCLIRFDVPPFKGEPTFETFALSDLMPRFPNLFREGIFSDLSSLIGVSLAVAFLASLENTLMAKSLASRTGDPTDVNQDMFSVGMANIAAAIGGGMPASGSLTRSTLNFESGAMTRFASLFSGVLTLGFAVLIAASLEWGVPLVDYVPKAALAALVIGISIGLFNLRHIKICLRSTGDDATVLVISFVATLLAPLHVAIFIGVAVSIALFLRKASRPHLIEYEFSDEGELREMRRKQKRPIPSISIVHVEGDLFFGAAELFRTQIQRAVTDEALKVIILRMKNARHLDATSVMALEDLIRFMRAKGLHLIISGATRDVYKVLKNSGVLETLQEGCNRKEGESNLFLQFPSNPNLSTRDALKRAQQLLGTAKAEIRIFYDPAQKPASP